jgi:hypothetical protein
VTTDQGDIPWTLSTDGLAKLNPNS